MTLSIVIPVLNDAPQLAETLRELQYLRAHDVEIIVIDGGSDDNSVAVAQSQADIVKTCRAGRAVQMNYGASRSSGKYIVFLHADSKLPSDVLVWLSEWELASTQWGFFCLRLNCVRRRYKIISFAINCRSKFTSVSTGDQCQFFSKDFFRDINGFPELALMEDVAISKVARGYARPFVVTASAVTSARRWQKQGYIKTILLMWSLRLAYCLGVSTDYLSRVYYRGDSERAD